MATNSTQFQYDKAAGPTQPLIGPVRNIETPQPIQMTADVLNNPQTPVKLAPTVKNTAPAAMIEQVSSANTASKAKSDAEILREQQVADQTAQLNKNSKDLKSVLGDLAGQGNEQIRLEEKAGIADKRAALDEINSQIESKTLAARRQIEDLQKAGGGLQGGQNIEIDRIQKESARELADLSIIQNARNRNLATAQSIIDRKVELETASLKQRADNLKFFYGENKQFLDKQEQRDFEKATKEADRIYEETKLEKKNLEDARLLAIQTAIRNGADNQTLSTIQRATTPEQALIAMGRYGRDEKDILLKNLQIQKLKNEVSANQPITGEWASIVNGVSGLVPSTKKQQTKENVANAIVNGEWSNAYTEIGNAVSDALTGANKTRFDGSRTDVNVMERFRTAIQDYADAGGQLGLLKGTEEEIKRKLGIDTPKASALATQLWREFQVYRNEMTGAAFTEKESRDYASVNPTLGKSLDLNLSVIDGSIAQLKNRVDSTIDSKVDKKSVQKIRDNLVPAQDQVKIIYNSQPKNQAAIDAMVRDGITWDDILKTLK